MSHLWHTTLCPLPPPPRSYCLACWLWLVVASVCPFECPMILSVLPCSWYILFGYELIWKNREPFVKLWHDLRTRGGGRWAPGLMGNVKMYKMYRRGLPRTRRQEAVMTSAGDVTAAVEMIPDEINSYHGDGGNSKLGLKMIICHDCLVLSSHSAVLHDRHVSSNKLIQSHSAESLLASRNMTPSFCGLSDPGVLTCCHMITKGIQDSIIV